jgi:hypothetical protein
VVPESRVKRIALLAVVAAAIVAPSAHATNECRGLMVCVPVAGPWVVTPSVSRIEYDLACPKGYVVAGLDAEVTSRGIDIGFMGALGSPVNPGITTQRDAVFLGRVVRGSPVGATFRPHIGCVPAQGGGGRTPTVHQALAPGKPVDRRVIQVPASHNRSLLGRCPKGERLSDATYAVGFYGAGPPTAAEARAVHVAQKVKNGTVILAIRSHADAVLQLDLLCVAA